MRVVVWSRHRLQYIDALHYFFHCFRIGRKSWKRFEQRLGARAVPEVADDHVIQEFSPVRCNDLMAAPNTLNSEHEHRTSFLHRGQSASVDP